MDHQIGEVFCHIEDDRTETLVQIVPNAEDRRILLGKISDDILKQIKEIKEKHE